MSPPSPSKSPAKFPMSPPMSLFPVSPERVASTKPPYGTPSAQSPSLPDLRTSPLRKHRRNDSDVSVHGLAAMFENLEVKDFKEAQAKYMVALQKEKTKHAAEITKMERKYQMMERYRVRVDELEHELKRKAQEHDGCIARDTYDKCRKDNRDAIAKWENAFKHVEEQREQMNAKIAKLSRNNEVAMAKGHVYKKAMQDAKDEAAHVKPQVAILRGKNEGLEKTLARVESDLRFYMKEAEKYKNECYILDMRVNATETHLGEELHTLKEKLSLVEGERDALKTSLKEEEVLRIAAEGQIPLPSATTDEYDDFGSPVRSPRKRQSFARDEEDKENVAPKKAAVELKLAQQELATEKRLRERAQEQIDFMKMECQFRCCSCRIADSKGSDYVHDNSYAAAIDAIKASFPAMTPPPSDHGDEHMEDVIKSEAMTAERPITPPAEEVQRDDRSAKSMDQTLDTVIVKRPTSTTPEPAVAFSPTTGTFRSISSAEKVDHSTRTVPSEKPQLVSSAITGLASPWVPNARRPQSRASIQAEQRKSKSGSILIHEDAVMDSDDDDEENNEPESPSRETSDPPATPYLTRTITTTTTIPLHFSPVTPAIKSGVEPLTPSTVAHAPTNAPTPVLGELNLNKLPIDREAALEAIRQRRGRARSMAMGQETPRKQMMEGVKERRDISAPVSRVRR
ncbi:uncharacterized protein N0V89_000921 [Didymosphaeria variabile]|uniref:Uncharacterized protein n=1 Tax=Didymosphaeria variabile TaxID=1932322 RepID=A0A9W8XYC8_9PLEO|nr:uncharacterized protein N0V89_000921 [Didymosphaeria variabile]KAJ4360359.1 hypothetical protein N0V89_000921 [Didymosphaeria variabile]